jgi:hypothetical protein
VHLDLQLTSISAHYGYAWVTTYRLSFAGVEAVRAERYRHWTGPGVPSDCSSPREREVAADDWASRGRTESVGWHEFENLVASDHLSVMDAALARSESCLAFRFGGYTLGEDTWLSGWVRASALRITRSDGTELNLMEFEKLGVVFDS